MNAIELKSVTKYFDNKKVIHECNFVFDKGKIYLIKGESGVGKTTLLNLLSGYIMPDTGEVKIASELKLEYLFQEDMIFSNLTVRENMEIKYGALLDRGYSMNEPDYEKILSLLNLEMHIDTKVVSLSGGEKQRLQLANIFISNADIILMDEPTSKLDEKNKEQVLNLIQTNFISQTIIVVCHDNLEQFLKCEVLYLEDGRLIHEKI